MSSTESSCNDLMKQLNPAQEQAVSIVEGPVLVVAGAGSGKTRVITYRIPYLLLTGSAQPENILALTFTNKAAEEMKNRVLQLSHYEFQPPRISTFHSFGALFLRRHIGVLGYNSRFVIYDEEDQLRLVKECCNELNLSENRYNPRDMHFFLKWHKSSLHPRTIYDPTIANLLSTYSRKLQAANAVDFEDLLSLPLKILQNDATLLERSTEQYRFLMVDEYQDTNETQYELLKLLAGKRANLMVVGDEDQSIYKFRGARPQNIQNFVQDFPNCKIVKLEQNYRSTKTIIKAAQAVISRNSRRIQKQLWTENSPGEPLEVYQAVDEYDEADFVTLRVLALLKQAAPREIALLYRANAQSRVLEESFIKAQIPHRIIGAVGFYERREIKDVIAFLRLKSNPEDSLSFLRIVNVPPRGVGKKQLEQIQNYAELYQVNLFEAGEAVGSRSLAGFLQLYKDGLETEPPSSFLEGLLRFTNYADYLQKEDPLSAADRLENIQEFLSYLRERESQPEFNLSTFLGDLPLLSRTEESAEAVTLLTVHSAKGLEFTNLFVVGMEEGLFPHIRSMENEEDVEEERRLFYVALTRAKQKLTLSWAQRRGLYGGSLSEKPSRFLEEIPSWFKVNRMSEKFGAAQRSTFQNATGSSQEPASIYRVGSRVRHEKFGAGTVLEVEGVPNDWKLTIRFPEGIKKILTRYAKLTIEK
jgi:DNA helicase-2/ATP-dependent DNA helicase PcrA